MSALRPSPFALPDQVADERIRLFYDYWLRKAPPGALPGRRHLDPLEMKEFLPHVLLIDVVHDAGKALRFRYRLVGTHVTLLDPSDLTGRFIDEIIPAEQLPRVLARFETLLRDKQPVYGTSPLPWRFKDFEKFEYLDLPLANDGNTVDMIFGWRFGIQPDPRRKLTSSF